MSRNNATQGSRRLFLRGPGRLTITFTPLIDIVFLLLLYFLLVAQFKSKEELFQLDLLDDNAGQAQRDPFALPIEPIRILLTSTGPGASDLTIETSDPLIGATPTLDLLTSALQEARATIIGADQLFLVEPTGDTRWEHALEVMNAVKRAGLLRVHLLEPTS
jgi:biopolymer transport protein ExbD